MKISKLFGMTVTNGKKRGVLMGVCCNGDKVCGFACCTADGGEFYAECGALCLKGGELLCTRFNKDYPEHYRLKLGKAAYTHEGTFLGFLRDCTLKGNRLVSAKIGNKTYPFEQLFMGDVIVLKSPESAAKNMFIDAIFGG